MALYYQPEGAWFADCMLFARGDTFYLYYLRDTRDPVPYEPFCWDLVTTRDFVKFNDLGTVIPKGGEDEHDQYVSSGSVFRDRTGLFHAFYGGYNRNFVKTDKPSQVIMHARSRDLLSWEKTPGLSFLPPVEGYDKEDWRDPFVLWDEDPGRYLMIIGARKIEGQKKLNACTVFFESEDCQHWTFKGPLWTPHYFTMHEMPDLFKIKGDDGTDWWYLVLTEFSDRSKTFYRMSRNLKGPWPAPSDDAFDGRAYYAARSFAHRGKRYLFGWVPSRNGNEDTGCFQWGGALVVHEIIQRQDGTLGTKIPDMVRNAFNETDLIKDAVIRSVDGISRSLLIRRSGRLFCFEGEITFEKGTRSFAIKIYENEETGEAYQFRFYVNDTALNVRMYRCFGECISFTVLEGCLNGKALSIARGIHA
jgi:beta-fructofuranosidase